MSHYSYARGLPIPEAAKPLLDPILPPVLIKHVIAASLIIKVTVMSWHIYL